MSLDDLMLEAGTDKSSVGHDYASTYEQLLWRFREGRGVLLEIGVAGGASLHVWREYLPRWSVYGVDNNQDALAGFQANGVFIGDQRDELFLQGVIRQIGRPDIVIDDGGHKASEQRASFQILFPLLSEDGLYVVEDTHAWYQDGYMDSEPLAREFFLGLIDTLTNEEIEIASLHFFRQLLAIWKK